MTQPFYHFVGYWSPDSGIIKTPTLKKILSTNASPLIKVNDPGVTSSSWGIGYLDLTTPPPSLELTGSNLTLASVSISGFVQPDAWVKVSATSLILGREPFGRVPLYWTQIDNILWFASQIKLLLPLFPASTVNVSGLYGYACFSYIPTPLTPVDKIGSIVAGTEQIWQRDQSYAIHRLHQWQSHSKLNQSEASIIDSLRNQLQAVIERQLVDLPTEPVGVFLSGGLDSSIVAALLVNTGVKVKAYTLDFGQFGTSEIPYAEEVANALKIPLVKVAATPQKIQAALVATVTALDLPFGDGVTVPLYLLCQAACQETTVVFNGEGGDQLFAGWTNKPMIAASVYDCQQLAGENHFTQRYLQTFHRFYGYESQVFSPQIQQQCSANFPQQWLTDALDSRWCPHLLDRLRRATLMLKGAQNIHPRATALAQTHGLWLRSPFCDLELATWAFQLPGDLCLNQACEKYILKKAVEPWLPPEIIWREKRGMGVPLTEWCFSELWSTLRYWLNPNRLRSEDRWYPDLALRVIKGNLGNPIRSRRKGELLWLLMMWQIWRTEVLGETSCGIGFNPLWLPYPFWQWINTRQE